MPTEMKLKLDTKQNRCGGLFLQYASH